MQKNRSGTIGTFLADHFAQEWKLLSETEAFVSHTPEFPMYEQQFKEWRARLQNRSTVNSDLVSLRSEIVELRKALRLQGYDLSLGLQRLVVQGFKNDECLAQGYRRVVLCFCDPDVFYHTGSGNHIAIEEELTDILMRKRLLRNPEYHYLWYLRNGKGLFLSGSATEPATGLERLQNRAAANPMKLLSALRNLS